MENKHFLVSHPGGGGGGGKAGRDKIPSLHEKFDSSPLVDLTVKCGKGLMFESAVPSLHDAG